MRKIRFWLISVALLVSLLLPGYANTAGAQGASLDLLALGDSLAAGVSEKGELGRGYADFLAIMLEKEGNLGSYNKGFAKPGYSTSNVITDLEQNVEKPLFGLDAVFGEGVSLKQSIIDAEIITLSVGANDVLGEIPKDKDGKVDVAAINQMEVMAAITEVAVNMNKILTQIRALNADAEIVVMGYYNPYPALKEMEIALAFLVNSMDEGVKNVVIANDAKFIDTKALIKENAGAYLPNPANIHLSEAGYKGVAQLMFEALTLPATPQEPLIPTLSDVKGHWAEKNIQQAISAGIFNGYPDGTFKPEKTLQRSEMTSLLARLWGLKTTTTSLPFTDITQVSTAMKAELQAVYDLGIVKGDGSGKFNPTSEINREQMGLMLVRAYEAQMKAPFLAQKELPYKDVANLSTESIKAISFLYEFGLIDSAQAFNPKGKLTRAQAAKMLSLLAAKSK